MEMALMHSLLLENFYFLATNCSFEIPALENNEGKKGFYRSSKQDKIRLTLDDHIFSTFFYTPDRHLSHTFSSFYFKVATLSRKSSYLHSKNLTGANFDLVLTLEILISGVTFRHDSWLLLLERHTNTETWRRAYLKTGMAAGCSARGVDFEN